MESSFAVRAAARVVILLIIAMAACSGSSGGPPRQTVKDAAGRTCTIIASEMTVRCDQPPMPSAGCPPGTTACFLEGTTGDASGPAAICAGCCTGNQGTSAAADCANIMCSTDEECPSDFSRCANGQCRY
jgi:hypothetical protein